MSFTLKETPPNHIKKKTSPTPSKEKKGDLTNHIEEEKDLPNPSKGGAQ